MEAQGSRTMVWLPRIEYLLFQEMKNKLTPEEAKEFEQLKNKENNMDSKISVLEAMKPLQDMHTTLSEIQAEVIRAKEKHPGNFHNLHEGYAVLLEEVDELWDEIKKKRPDIANVKTEAIQIAAMAARIIMELT